MHKKAVGRSVFGWSVGRFSGSVFGRFGLQSVRSAFGRFGQSFLFGRFGRSVRPVLSFMDGSGFFGGGGWGVAEGLVKK